ncbi:MAG: PEP-CTERM sorting domain-containing protein [Gemmatimonadaceae bacterium]|nr:PEP-CTERM sorting domain-containing protein [Gemmatimonadaceae bacterium]
MNKKILILAASIAATVGASPASAQLSATRVDACFQNQSGSTTGHQSSNGNSVTACSSNATNTWWSMPGTYSSQDDYFMFERATPGALTFGANNLSNTFNLGYFYFSDNSNNGGDRSTTLKFEFTFAGYVGEWAYSGLTVNYDDRGSSAERFSFSGGAWSDWFTVGGDQYRFAVVGFDTPHPGSAANYCKDYDAIPSTGQYTEANNGKLCGQFEKKAAQVAEPATLTLVAAGFAGLVGVARRRREV